MKFDFDTGSTIDDNYIHDNYNAGIWLDTGNSGETIEGNYLARNWGTAIDEEVSYYATIENNTIIDNAWGSGSTNSAKYSNTAPALYISSSSFVTVSGNVFTDNWSDISVFQASNLFCGSPSAPGTCPIYYDGSVVENHNPTFNQTTCTANIATSAPGGSPNYYDGCQWKAGNITISDNVFNFNADDIRSATPTLPDTTVATVTTVRITPTTATIHPCVGPRPCGRHDLLQSFQRQLVDERANHPHHDHELLRDLELHGWEQQRLGEQHLQREHWVHG